MFSLEKPISFEERFVHVKKCFINLNKQMSAFVFNFDENLKTVQTIISAVNGSGTALGW